jgi:ATP-dependent DNA helicase RecG
LPASDRRADNVYLDQVDRSSIYLGLFGDEYGFENTAGVSPTEREFDRATAQGKIRLIYIKCQEDKHRHPKMLALIRKAGGQFIRRRFSDIPERTGAVSESLADHLVSKGLVQDRPFENDDPRISSQRPARTAIRAARRRVRHHHRSRLAHSQNTV